LRPANTEGRRQGTVLAPNQPTYNPLHPKEQKPELHCDGLDDDSEL